jgi:tripartite motif-containing protein 71
MTTKQMIVSLTIITIVFSFLLLFKISQIKFPDAENAIQSGNSKLNLETVISSSANLPLKNPIDLAVTRSGKIFVTDSDHHRIQVFSQNGEFLFSFGSLGEGEGQLYYPVSIVVDHEKNVYVAELYNQRISVFTENGKFRSSFRAVGQGGATVVPTAMAIDRKGFLYVIDKVDNTVKKLNKKGDIILSFGKLGSAEGEFQYPLGIEVSDDGQVVVSDTGNNRIQVFSPEGVLSKVVPVPLGPPSGVAVGPEGEIYFTEPTNGQVAMEQDAPKKPIVLLRAEDVNKDSIFFPEGVEIVNGYMYLTDKGTNRIYIYELGSK